MQLVTEENITELAAARWGTARDPRLAEIMQALVRHLHEFAREVRLTEPEWMAAIQWLARTGQISDDKREEFILASDVLGLSMLVVQMNHRLDPGATPATVLGPFHIEGSPELVAERIARAFPHVEAARLVAAPDCGMKYLPRESAEGKMRAMVGAAALLRAAVQEG